MSAYAVEISPDAFEDLRAIQTYISRELGSPAAAARTVRQILETIGRLERFPLRNGILATLPMGVCSGGQRQRTTLLSMSRLTARSLYLPSFMEGATSKSVWQGCSDAARQCGHTADLCIMAKRDFDLRVTSRCMARTSTTGAGRAKRCVPAPNSVQSVSCTALPLQALAHSSASDCPYWDGLDVS